MLKKKKVNPQVKLADKDFEITLINRYKKIEGKVYKIDEKN